LRRTSDLSNFPGKNFLIAFLLVTFWTVEILLPNEISWLSFVY
jgi:hypothetical protein